MLAFASISLLLATTAAAIPSAWQPRPRDANSECGGITGGLASIKSFTLAAVNSTGPNANAGPGARIVLGQAGVIAGASFHVFTTYESYPYNDWTAFTLVDGGLIATGNQAATIAGHVNSGDEPAFITTNPAPAPSPVYCAVPSASAVKPATALLALNGHTDLFSLCESGSGPYAQMNVVYNATSNSFTYDASTCYPVTLKLSY